MSFHMEAIRSARLARDVAAAADARATRARILAQVACPHEDAATVTYSTRGCFRICMCCGLQIHDWHGAYQVIGERRYGLPEVTVAAASAVQLGPLYYDVDDWHKASAL